jgi:hypothetical protein
MKKNTVLMAVVVLVVGLVVYGFLERMVLSTVTLAPTPTATRQPTPTFAPGIDISVLSPTQAPRRLVGFTEVSNVTVLEKEYIEATGLFDVVLRPQCDVCGSWGGVRRIDTAGLIDDFRCRNCDATGVVELRPIWE